MLEPLSLQLALAQRLGSVLQSIPPQDGWVPSRVSYRLRWGRNPGTISYLCDFNPDLPLHHRRSLASMILADWGSHCGMPPVLWPQVMGSHCLPQILSSGQILFTPAPLALGAWLWQVATTDEDFQPYPQVGLSASPSLPDPALAKRLQLSLEAVVLYTYGRCRQLLAIAAASVSLQFPLNKVGQIVDPAFPLTDHPCPHPAHQGYELGLNLKREGGDDRGMAVGVCHSLYPVGYGETVLWGLVKLVDCLTLAPLTQGNLLDSHCFNAAYGLSVAVDGWLGNGTVDSSALSTIALLRGIERALATTLLGQGRQSDSLPPLSCSPSLIKTS